MRTLFTFIFFITIFTCVHAQDLYQQVLALAARDDETLAQIANTKNADAAILEQFLIDNKNEIAADLASLQKWAKKNSSKGLSLNLDQDLRQAPNSYFLYSSEDPMVKLSGAAALAKDKTSLYYFYLYARLAQYAQRKGQMEISAYYSDLSLRVIHALASPYATNLAPDKNTLDTIDLFSPKNQALLESVKLHNAEQEKKYFQFVNDKFNTDFAEKISPSSIIIASTEFDSNFLYNLARMSFNAARNLDIALSKNDLAKIENSAIYLISNEIAFMQVFAKNLAQTPSDKLMPASEPFNTKILLYLSALLAILFTLTIFIILLIKIYKISKYQE